MKVAVSVGLAVLMLLPACANEGSDAAFVGPSASPAAQEPPMVAVEDAEAMTIAEVLRTDPRSSRFRAFMERVETPIAESVLAVWDWPATQMGENRDNVTVFAPLDTGFEKLDPSIVAVIEDPDVDNALLYSVFGHHYVHRLYPSDMFEPGDQATWKRSISGPVQLTLDPLAWGGHPIVATDIRTANGITHAIDGVVVPDALATAAAE